VARNNFSRCCLANIPRNRWWEN